LEDHDPACRPLGEEKEVCDPGSAWSAASAAGGDRSLARGVGFPSDLKGSMTWVRSHRTMACAIMVKEGRSTGVATLSSRGIGRIPWRGEADTTARRRPIPLAQGMALTDPMQEREQAFRYGTGPRGQCLILEANTLWCLDFPTQALDYFFSLVNVQLFAAVLRQRCREAPAVQAQADALLTLTTAQRVPDIVGNGTFYRGWAPAMQGQHEEMHQGLAALLAAGNMVGWPSFLLWLAEAVGHAGHVDDGLCLLAEA
jgi:hypothetical protein